jgi:hypothetical protein
MQSVDRLKFSKLFQRPTLDILGYQYQRTCATQWTLDSSRIDADLPQNNAIESTKSPSWLPARRVSALRCACRSDWNQCGIARAVDESVDKPV